MCMYKVRRKEMRLLLLLPLLQCSRARAVLFLFFFLLFRRCFYFKGWVGDPNARAAKEKCGRGGVRNCSKASMSHCVSILLCRSQ